MPEEPEPLDDLVPEPISVLTCEDSERDSDQQRDDCVPDKQSSPPIAERKSREHAQDQPAPEVRGPMMTACHVAIVTHVRMVRPRAKLSDGGHEALTAKRSVSCVVPISRLRPRWPAAVRFSAG